jgi:hypothetical protein
MVNGSSIHPRLNLGKGEWSLHFAKMEWRSHLNLRKGPNLYCLMPNPSCFVGSYMLEMIGY